MRRQRVAAATRGDDVFVRAEHDVIQP
jgi:hypothetical protein